MKIPAAIRALLWEYSLGKIPEERSQSTIIERVMQRGCWDDMVWMLREFDRERLRSFLRRWGRRVLAPRELRFWFRVCGVPESDQDVWLQEARTREKAWRG